MKNRKIPMMLAIVLLFTITPAVAAQPHWSWRYDDECMVFAMDFNSRGYLALAFGYYAVLLTPEGKRVFKSPTRDLAYSIAVSDNNYVLAGTRGNFVQLFNPTGKLVFEYKTGDQVWAVDISKDGTRFVAGSNDGWVYYFSGKELLWKANTGAPIWGALMTPRGIITGNDAGSLILYSYNGSVVWKKNLNGRIWRVRVSGNYVAVLSLHTGEAVTSDVYLLTLDGNTVWRRHFEEYVRDVDVDNGTVAITGDIGEILAVGLNNETLWEFPNFNPAWHIAFRKGYTLAGGGGHVAFFIDPSGNPVWIFEDNLSITAVAMSPNGRYLAVADRTFEQINCRGHVYFLDRLPGGELVSTTSTSGVPGSGPSEGELTSTSPTGKTPPMDSGATHTPTATPTAGENGENGFSREKISFIAVTGIVLLLMVLLVREMRE